MIEKGLPIELNDATKDAMQLAEKIYLKCDKQPSQEFLMNMVLTVGSLVFTDMLIVSAYENNMITDDNNAKVSYMRALNNLGERELDAARTFYSDEDDTK